MRLLYVIHQFFPDCHSGTEQHCLAVAREAQRRGHEVTVLSLHWQHERQDPPIRLFDQPIEGLRVIRLNHWRGINPNDVLRDYENLHLEGHIQQVIDDLRPDAVHSFHLRQLGSNLLRVFHRAGLRIVVTLTDFWFICPRFTLLRPNGEVCAGPPDNGRGCIACNHNDLEGLDSSESDEPLSSSPRARLHAALRRKTTQLENLALADHIIAPSNFLAKVFRENGLKHQSLRVVPYGLEADRIQRIPAERPRQPLRIGFCGVMSPWKGPSLLVEAIRGSTVDAHVSFHGRIEEAMFQGYIDGMIESAEGDHRITFAGAYDESDAASIFADMDVLVVPSTWYENTPFVALEAFAAGVPVIASDLGGLSEVVTDRNGMLFRPNDATALQHAIEHLAANRNWFAELEITPPPKISECFDAIESCYSTQSPHH